MRRRVKVVLCLAGLAWLSVFASGADNEHAVDRSQTNRDIWVQAGETTADVSCVNCSIHVRGHVLGDVFALHGSVTVEEGGQIGGDVATVLGDVRVESRATIGGDVAALGGKVRLDPTGQIGGDQAHFKPIWVILIALIPLFVIGAIVALIVWLVQRRRRPPPLARAA